MPLCACCGIRRTAWWIDTTDETWAVCWDCQKPLKWLVGKLEPGEGRRLLTELRHRYLAHAREMAEELSEQAPG